MNNQKYLIIAGVILVVLIVGFLIFNSAKSPNNSGNQGSNGIPEYVLSAAEEENVKEFAKSFINLYNSYRFADFSNLSALGDYQTPEMQLRTQARITFLETNIPVGFEKETKVDLNTFKYSYPQRDRLSVSFNAEVTETLNSSAGVSPRSEESKKTYTQNFEIFLQPYMSGWLVSGLVP